MKGNLLLLALLASALCGCQKEVSTESPEYVRLSLDVCVDGAAKTRVSDVTATADETSVKTKQFAIFNGNTLEAYLPNGTTVANLRTGVSYTVIAVVNGPSISSCSTIAAIEAVTADLGTYNGSSNGFVMYGTTTTGTLSAATTISVNVSRLVSRVRLVSINKTGIPAGTTCNITGVFLSNVQTECSMAGSVTASKYSNWYGRSASNSIGSNKITGASGAKASPEALTWSTQTSDVKFYTYPNTSTAFPAPSSSKANSSPALVVVATWNGTTCYYPVPIADGTTANYTYDVTLTITGAGSNDPQVKPSLANLTCAVTVNPWGAGNNYNVTY